MQRVRCKRLPAVVAACCATGSRRRRGSPAKARHSRPAPAGDAPNRCCAPWRRRTDRRPPVYECRRARRRLISITRSGRSTPSFIRSTSVVPPARKRTLAPCCAVGDSAPAAIAAAVAGANEIEGLHGQAPAVAQKNSSAARRHLLDRPHDVRISAAAADIAAHEFANVVIRSAARFAKQRHRRHDLPGGAITALIGVVLQKSRLHRMQPSGRAEPFDGDDLIAVMRGGEREATVHAAAADMDGAGAALAVVATLLGAGEMQDFAQAIEQGHARIDRNFALLAVDAEFDAELSIRRIGCHSIVNETGHRRRPSTWKSRRGCLLTRHKHDLSDVTARSR